MASSGKTEEPSPSTDAAVGAERLSFPQHLASGGFLGRPTPKVPKEGQESVWAPPFTRPPTLRKVARHAVVEVGDVVIADAKEAYQVCETSHPPTWCVYGGCYHKLGAVSLTKRHNLPAGTCRRLLS